MPKLIVMKKIVLTRLMTSFAFLALLLAGCKKENSDTLTPAQEAEAARFSVESETESEVVFNDVFDNVMGVNSEVGIGGTGIFGRVSSTSGTVRNEREMDVDSLPGCVTITTTRLNLPNAFPVQVTIDFGTGCQSNNHLRSGKIKIVYSGRLIIPGNSATTTFENFTIDGISVQGEHKVTNTTALGSNQRQWTITVTNAKLTKPNGNYSQWNSNRVITQIEGNGTLLPHDDIFRIQGSAHGRVKRGDLLYAWHSEIVEPLIKKFTCRWISKGTLRVVRETLPSNSPHVAVLNYGEGVCDYFAKIILNGVPHDIELPH